MGFGNRFSGLRERRNQSRGRIALFIGLFVLGGSASGWAQVSSQVGAIGDVLGPHGDRTRGCEICHVPRLGPQREAGKPAEKAPEGLWGQIAAPAYGSHVPLESEMRMAEVRPDRTASGKQETVGILLCLSCHDGSLTPQNMMQGWSYERQVGLLNQTPYWDAKIPTLLGDAEAPAREHPLGVAARIPTGGGLVWANGTFSVIPKSPYAQFVANYGAPALMSTNRTAAYGINGDGEPYALCTTCHDQHVRSVFASDPNHPIAGDGGGKVYTTFFFVNGPYNPTANHLAHQNASSSAQFCRQCHFEDSNERNNVNGVPTLFF
jgi:hypothetical protein